MLGYGTLQLTFHTSLDIIVVNFVVPLLYLWEIDPLAKCSDRWPSSDISKGSSFDLFEGASAEAQKNTRLSTAPMCLGHHRLL